MVKHWPKKPRRVFALVPLHPSHLEEIVSWIGTGAAEKDGDTDDDALRMRMYTEFRRQYRPLWSSGYNETLVMTVNRVPVFCVSLLRLRKPGSLPQTARSSAHIYLLYRPQVHDSERLLLLAWQAATVHAFLRMDLSMVQAAVNADLQEENEALLTLGYKLEESVSEASGKINLYRCVKEEMRVVM